MSKTLDYGGNGNSENDGKHVRSRQSATQHPKSVSVVFALNAARIFIEINLSVVLFTLV